MTDKTIKVTDANFEEEVIKSDIPVLVDFWAAWCMPCKMLTPILKEIAEEMEGKIKIAKLDVDNSPQSAGQYGIRSIPSLLIFKSGSVVEQIIGALPKNTIQQKIDNVI
ncbi:MAG: thioredoxin [Candidatus Marinimicrobia bacterium]|nr:thioredoxin [Candidatus Neomarinimicrobiota bacterium]